MRHLSRVMTHTARKYGVAGAFAAIGARAFKTRRAPVPCGTGARGSGGDLLSRARGPGTIGDRRLDFRVRNGNGYDPPSVTAEISKSDSGKAREKRAGSWAPLGASRRRAAHARQKPRRGNKGKASRAISTARLNASPRLHLRPIDVIVSDGPSGGCPRET